MGRRSINTTKSGKYMNPTDQARKEARKKELKKNKKQRQMVRAAVLKNKDPGQLLEEMEKIDEMEYNVMQPSPLNEKVLRDKRRKLKETFDRVMRLYHTDEPEQWAELKRKEVEYEKKRLKKQQYYESVKTAQTVQIDEIPLPSATQAPPSTNTTTLTFGTGSGAQTRLPPPPTALSLPPFAPGGPPSWKRCNDAPIRPPDNTAETKKKEQGSVPPGPPPNLFEMSDLDTDAEDDKVKLKEYKPHTKKRKSRTLQNLDDFMKEMENVHKRKEKERKEKAAAARSTRKYSRDDDSDSGEDERGRDNGRRRHRSRDRGRSHSESSETSLSDSNDSRDSDGSASPKRRRSSPPPTSKPSAPNAPPPGPPMAARVGMPPPPMGTMPPHLPPPSVPGRLGPPMTIPAPPLPPVTGLAPPPMLFRPPPLRPPNSGGMPNFGMPPRMPPGGPPRPSAGGPRMGIRMPPGPPPGPPPPGMARHHKNHQQHHQGAKESNKGVTTITAKPQIRNLSADVTRFLPSTLRVKREETRKPNRPKGFSNSQDSAHLHSSAAGGGEANKAATKDDAYMQFMNEMQGLL